MEKDILLDKVKDIVSNILRNNGIETVDITYKRESGSKVLRILADKEGGINVDECARMNEIIGAALDKTELINENYVLEVSSPGLNRPLKTKEDFLRMKGKKIRVHTYESIEDKRKFIGVLTAADEGHITVSDENARLIKIPIGKISKATFDYEGLI